MSTDGDIAAQAARLFGPAGAVPDAEPVGLGALPAAAAESGRAMAGAGTGDASDLVATVERARALLDEDDVMNARILARKAYGDAESIQMAGIRFKAGHQLMDKARRLQGDALLIEARANIRIADEWDAAQQSGKASKGGRPKTVSTDDGFTAGQAGLTRQEIHEARRLRDAEAKQPGLAERAIEARIAQGLKPSRASLRHAIGTRSAGKDERGDDLYETPPEAVRALLGVESFGGLPVWEPACGRGAISALLEAAGLDVLLSDLVDRGCTTRHGEVQEVGDFLATHRADDGIRGPWRGALCVPEGGFDIVTNPPYGSAVLNRFVRHALTVHRPRKLALLLNLNAMCGTEDADRNFWMEEWPPARIHVLSRRLPMMHRDGWDGPKASSQMNTAWFVWESSLAGKSCEGPTAPRALSGCSETDTTETPYRGPTVLTRLDWKDHAEAAE